MDLYLLRHGQSVSGRTHSQLMVTSGEIERTLTIDGKAEVERVGEALEVLNFKPDVIVTSPLKRSCQTAEIIGSILFGKKEVKKRKSQQIKRYQVWNDLAPEGDMANVFKNLSEFKYDSKILVVGHEPFLSKMIAETLNSAGYDNAVITTVDGRNHSSSSTSYLKNKENLDRSIVLKKAGLAKLRISSMSPKLTGELRWLLTPMLLRKISSAKRKNKIKSPRYQRTDTLIATHTRRGDR